MSRRLNVQNREVTCIDPPRQTKAVRNRKHGIINAEQKDCEEETQEKTASPKILNYYALIDFAYDDTVKDHATSGVLCTFNSLLIGSKLDTDIHLNQCRIAFYGHVLHSFTNRDFKEAVANSGLALSNNRLADLKIYKEKYESIFVKSNN